VLPDGRVASDNAELVAAAAAMLRQRSAPGEPFSPWGLGLGRLCVLWTSARGAVWPQPLRDELFETMGAAHGVV